MTSQPGSLFKHLGQKQPTSASCSTILSIFSADVQSTVGNNKPDKIPMYFSLVQLEKAVKPQPKQVSALFTEPL